MDILRLRGDIYVRKEKKKGTLATTFPYEILLQEYSLYPKNCCGNNMIISIRSADLMEISK